MICFFKELICSLIFVVDIVFSFYFLYKFIKIYDKKMIDYLLFTCLIGFSIIKLIICISILRLFSDPINMIYTSNITYIHMDYNYLFNIFKKNLLNNYIAVFIFGWAIQIYYYWFLQYKEGDNYVKK